MRSKPTAKSAKGLALIGFMLVSVACVRSPEAKSAKYMTEGKKFLEKKDPARAILQFRNAAQATPRDPEVYYQLGLAFLADGDIRQGVAALRKTLELNPHHVAAQFRLAALMTYANDSAILRDAQERLNTLLQSTPDDADTLHALALADLKLGERKDAMDLLERAIVAAPQELIIAVTLAQAKAQQQDYKGAEEVLKKACQSSPDSVDAVIVLGRFYSVRDRTADAEQQFRRAVAMDPQGVTAKFELATLQRRMGRKQEAEQGFKQLANVSDKTYRPVYGIFLFEEGRHDEAILEFERLTKEDPDDRALRTRLVTAYRLSNRVPDAEKLLDKALKKNSKDLDALLQRGDLFLKAGNYRLAEVDLDEVIRLQPNSAEAHYMIGRLHQANGATLTYRQDLSKALELDPDLLVVRLELAQVLIVGQEAQAALDLLNQTPEFQRDSLLLLEQRNWALWALGDMEEMRKGIDLGLSRQRTTDFLLQDGVWKLRARKFSGAKDSLEQALNLDPGDLRALGALNQTYVAQNQSSMALQKIKEYAAREPTSAPVQEFLGVLQVAKGERPQARAAFESAIAADANFVTADLSLAQLDVADGKMDDAARRLEKILSSNRSNTTARLWLGNIEITKGNHKAALDDFRQVIASDPNNSLALNNYAYLLSDVNPTEALKYAQKAKELAPGDPAYSDTLGWILYQKGLYPMAVSELERAVARGADPVYQYHLAMAYAKAGNINGSRATLRVGMKLNPDLPEARMAQEMLDGAKP